MFASYTIGLFDSGYNAFDLTNIFIIYVIFLAAHTLLNIFPALTLTTTWALRLPEGPAAGWAQAQLDSRTTRWVGSRVTCSTGSPAISATR